MADSNKRLNLELDLNDKGFRDKIKNLISEISKANDAVGAPSRGNYSNLPANERHRIEQSRYQEVSSKFYKNYNEDAIVSAKANVRNKGAFARPEDQYVAQTSQQLEKLQKALQESTTTQRTVEYEQKNRQREYRSLSTKQLETEKDRLRVDVRKAEKNKDFETADSKQSDLDAVERAMKQRDSRSPELKFMQQAATNMFIGKALNSATGLMGHGTQQFSQSAQTGFNGYSAARAAGMGKGGAGLIGLAIGAADLVLGSMENGKKLDSARKEAQGLGNFDRKSYMGSGAYSDLGMDQIQYQEKYNEKQKNARFQGNIAARVLEEERLAKGFGLSSGDLRGVTDYQTKGGRSTTDSVAGFAGALQSLGLINTDQKDKDLSLLPKYMDKMVTLQEKIYNVTGERSDENTLRSMSLLTVGANLGGIFKDEKQGLDLVQGIQNKYTNPGDEYEKYVNLQSMRSVFGNMSDSDLRMKQESMGADDLANVTNEKVRLIRERYGNQRFTNAGKDQYLQSLQAGLGIDSYTKTAKFDEQFDQAGGLNSTNVNKFLGDKNMKDLIKKQAEDNTSKLEAAGATAVRVKDDTSANSADAAGVLLKSGAEAFDTAVDKFGDFIGGLFKKGTTSNKTAKNIVYGAMPMGNIFQLFDYD